MHLIANTDGGSRGDRTAGIGVVIYARDYKFKISQYIGLRTNNEAEYEGLLTALRWAIKLKAESLLVRMDSELVVKQLLGEYRVKHPVLKPLFDAAQKLIAQLPSCAVEHVRREFNQEADMLANQAMDAKNKIEWVASEPHGDYALS